MGDIGNVVFVDSFGKASFDVVRDLLLLTDSAGSNIMGRGIILHELVDIGAAGLPAQTGGAGKRFMQGVIGISGRTSFPAALPNLQPSANAGSSSSSSSSSSSGSNHEGSTGASTAPNGNGGSSGDHGAASAFATVQPLMLLALAALLALML